MTVLVFWRRGLLVPVTNLMGAPFLPTPRHCNTVMLVNKAHCNAGNISDRRLVPCANGFGIAILQPASSTEGMVAVTVSVFFRQGLSVPVTKHTGCAVCTYTTVLQVTA